MTVSNTWRAPCSQGRGAFGVLWWRRRGLAWIRKQQTPCLGVSSPGLLGGHFGSLTPSQKDMQLAQGSASLRLCDSSPQTYPPRRKVRAAPWTLGRVSA